MVEKRYSIQQFQEFLVSWQTQARAPAEISGVLERTAFRKVRDPHDGEPTILLNSPDTDKGQETDRIRGIAATFNDIVRLSSQFVSAAENGRYPQMPPFFRNSLDTLAEKLINALMIIQANLKEPKRSSRRNAVDAMKTNLIQTIYHLSKLAEYNGQLEFPIDNGLLSLYLDHFREEVNTLRDQDATGQEGALQPKNTGAHDIATALGDYKEAFFLKSDVDLIHEASKSQMILESNALLERVGTAYQQIRFAIYQDVLAFLQTGQSTPHLVSTLSQIPQGPKDITTYISKHIIDDFLDLLLIRLETLISKGENYSKSPQTIDLILDRIEKILEWSKRQEIEAKLPRKDTERVLSQLDRSIVSVDQQQQIRTQLEQLLNS